MSNNKSFEDLSPPEEFCKIINDFTSDILITFPEYSGIISKWWNRPSTNLEEGKQKETLFVFRHCLKIFPERFFDILYKNISMFQEEEEFNTEFLPGIVFKQLWNCDISDNTKDTIWKYLQLILFAVIGSVHNSSELGDTAKLFEAINEDELKNKLQETLENMQNLFSNRDETNNGENNNENSSNFSYENMPNADDINDHIRSMMGGKLGKLAMELAEETASDLNLDMENTGDVKDVFQNLFKNPGKMMNMVKNIGTKIDEKIKSGELKESELMEEGMELLNKMKDMPGMGDMQKMFSQMGIPGLGKGGKLNMGAMEAQLNRNMKNAKMKERMATKMEMNAKMKASNNNSNSNVEQKPLMSEEELIKIFSTGEKVEKTLRGTKPPSNSISNSNHIDTNLNTNSGKSKNKNKKKGK
jgi:hypothetical protein